VASKNETILNSLQDFARAVAAKSKQVTAGEPEDQLRTPFETFLQEAGRLFGFQIVSTGETKLSDPLGKPDFAVHKGGLLAGYVELKAPGNGANPNRFKGHDRDQWKKFRAIPNLIYCDGNEWALYHSGERAGKIVRLTGDRYFASALDAKKANGLEREPNKL